MTRRRRGSGSSRIEPAAPRRRFLQGLAALPLLGWAGGLGASDAPLREKVARERVRALLLSATTLAGRGSLEHAREELAALYADRRRILLINFASLPRDRDAYAARMQRDFARIDERFQVRSLHAVSAGETPAVIRSAEAIFVSGGNTFLLLRELYDRYVLELLRERVLNGLPYAGSSAGSNIAGTVIGATNDFPLVDIPTRRSLGILPGVFNPHHPGPGDAEAFASRQWKIRQYATYHPEACIIGVNNPGMIRIEDASLSLRGEGAVAVIQRGEASVEVADASSGNISRAIAGLEAEGKAVADE